MVLHVTAIQAMEEMSKALYQGILKAKSLVAVSYFIHLYNYLTHSATAWAIDNCIFSLIVLYAAITCYESRK